MNFLSSSCNFRLFSKVLTRSLLQGLLIYFLITPLETFANLKFQSKKMVTITESFKGENGKSIKIKEDDFVEEVEGKPNLIIWCDNLSLERHCGIVDTYQKKLVLKAEFQDINPINYRDTIYYLVTDNKYRVSIVDDSFNVQVTEVHPYGNFGSLVVYARKYADKRSQDTCYNYDYDSTVRSECVKNKGKPYLFTKKGNKFGILEFDNTIRLPFIYDRIDINSQSSNDRILFQIIDDKGVAKYGYLDENFEIAIPAKYDAAYMFSLGVANVKMQGKYGFIDGNDNTIIDFNYDKADGMLWRSGFNEATAKVVYQGMPRLVGLSGEHYDYRVDQAQLLTYHHGRALIENMQGKYSFVTSNGELLTPFKFDKAENFIIRFDNEGKEIISAQVIENGESFIIDQTGKVTNITLYTKEKRPILSGKAAYEKTCQVCHQAGLLGAPKIGDINSWKNRIKKGKSVLYNHAINGFNKMPAKGGTDVTDKEVKNAVDYMLAAVQ